MNDHEKILFVLCFRLAVQGMKPRVIIGLLNDTIPHRRCWYYLKKWSDLGIYEYGTTIDLGWFVPAVKMPERYRKLLEEKK